MRRITWQLKNQKPFEPYTQKAFFLLKNGNNASTCISLLRYFSPFKIDGNNRPIIDFLMNGAVQLFGQ